MAAKGQKGYKGSKGEYGYNICERSALANILSPAAVMYK